MHPRYTGPIIVISRNKGGAYIVAELDGSLYNWPIAAFCLIPYFARQHIDLPPLENLLDVSIEWLRELEDTTYDDTDEYLEEEPPDTDPIDEDDNDWGQSIFQ